LPFKFRLYLEDGEDVGVLTTAVPGPWDLGEEFEDGQRRRWRIVDAIDEESLEQVEGDFAGVWIVEPR
jgi:hypothetical protein